VEYGGLERGSCGHRPAGDVKVAWNLVVVDGPEGEILEVEQARAIFDALEWLNREGSEEG
jgi:hypothetical protein